ncbi:pyrimidine-specific ribonucleoside hydrolase RihA-like isoform X2 [Dreissena polymorpha]|uniref:Inosine/uridine-preferring nucleoside hydrolase domain-containing protein n=1 Tax=Dreissena polymorpha TaxID=45954 RepID=A0A9D4J2V2_DREPO|nr:pyrimidine-specific ribonucleoside hydrolase RihA-like isoform X2 [Dreissena polymorpha]XP_052222166.1 pyrimidine-specific ribonucleoside hydrolase RihA-like isoform X2 [Dreissena polymorpha]KAH3796340.1 hypothetical protein DPMN_149908 [Dreissena polymorpha]
MSLSQRKKLLIDTDAGCDDAQAILMALKNPDVDVIGITCVAGNADADQVGRNVLRVLQVADRLDIPVFLGCNEPLLGDKRVRSEYHGKDGFGDAPSDDSPDESLLQSEHAVLALSRLSRQHCNELSLVCLGPLTNIAVCIRMDPKFGTRLRHCYIMGGNHEGKGNQTVCAEFNFYYDPDSAYVVLNQLTSPITMVTWETCLKHSLPWDVYKTLRANDSVCSVFLRKIEKSSFNFSMKQGWERYLPADEILMAVVLNTDVIKTCVAAYASVELKGFYTVGQLVVDWTGMMKRQKNVHIVTECNQSVYEKMLQNIVGI